MKLSESIIQWYDRSPFVLESYVFLLTDEELQIHFWLLKDNDVSCEVSVGYTYTDGSTPFQWGMLSTLYPLDELQPYLSALGLTLSKQEVLINRCEAVIALLWGKDSFNFEPIIT